MEKKHYNINIQDYLPHRKPMLMVDKILEIDSKNVITLLEIRENIIFLENGFLTESGLTEHMAQTCSSIFGQVFFENKTPESKKLIGFITNIKKMEIFSLPKTGDTIISKAEKLSEFENISHINCRTFCNEILLAEAEIIMFIREV